MTGAMTGLLLSAAVLAVPQASAWAATPHSASVVASKHFFLNTALSGVRLQRESRLSNGDYTATWKVRGETVTVAAPSGSTVTLPSPGATSTEVSVKLPPLPKSAQLAAARLRPANSIIPNALAVGFTPAQARAMAKKAQSSTRLMYYPGEIIATPCASVSGDSGHAWGHACDTQKFMQDNGGGNWIVGDEVVGSGNDPCCGTANLTNLSSWVSYGANNEIFNWSPNATLSVGGCTTYTATAGYNGVGLSASTQVCDELSPVDANSGTQFGSSWGTCDWQGRTEGNASTDVDNNPWNASDAVTLWVHIAWVQPNPWGGC
jgi:hypothetical protein